MIRFDPATGRFEFDSVEDAILFGQKVASGVHGRPESRSESGVAKVTPSAGAHKAEEPSEPTAETDALSMKDLMPRALEFLRSRPAGTSSVDLVEHLSLSSNRAIAIFTRFLNAEVAKIGLDPFTVFRIERHRTGAIWFPREKIGLAIDRLQRGSDK